MCGTCGCNVVEDNKIENTQNKKILQHTHQKDEPSFLVNVEQELLAENQHYAEQNKKYFKEKNILTLNILSSPGSGKTTLLVKTITDLKNAISMAVIEGDQHTELDADQIRTTQASVVQINTGKMCHLDAHAIGHALEELKISENSLLFIENVGNLICPALFNLGENCKVVILSITEGENKPLKYPHIFREAELMLINKIDLLPYVSFDVEKCIEYAKKINPAINILTTSALTSNGLNEWYNWLLNKQINQRCNNYA